jgi:hypothetical protein
METRTCKYFLILWVHFHFIRIFQPDENTLKAAMSKKGPISKSSLPPYGIDPIQAEGRLPWILTVPKEPYYEGVE